MKSSYDDDDVDMNEWLSCLDYQAIEKWDARTCVTFMRLPNSDHSVKNDVWKRFTMICNEMSVALGPNIKI